MKVYVGKSKARPRGTCDWCGQKDQKLTWTAYRIDGLHIVRVCDRCFARYPQELARRLSDPSGNDNKNL